MSSQVDTLSSVLSKTERLIGGVQPGQGGLPTPCPGYDVSALVDHLVGWLQVFAGSAEGAPPADDPGGSTAGDQPAEEFHQAAVRAVTAFRDGAAERTLTLTQRPLPGNAVLGMMLMEYVGHGWDLAIATGQPVPFDDDEAQEALSAGGGMLRPEFRGPGKPFAEVVSVPDSASTLERLVGFLGRQP